MRRTHHHPRLYYLMGKLLQGFFILLYGFFIICLLLVIAVGAEAALAFLTTHAPWIFKLGLTFGCAIAILSLYEAL
ncbi:hypothetical protein IQ260_07240 [Leptolyngbya cf. ectocarpi LEGE 11479]|uniref:Uncharacterized protein n=1 Tax=Leptolyngbya cf. ectocarpi LEGE 11479 TaxID=1828722 RepID=A0A928X4I9_LEPEC|nr:hypothetical protein [Leptolyngbya ectocarpi]MBE9066443.1 hypothetical protein [Leptolyngbya cf. ectocarpi LEGE 11479]